MEGGREAGLETRTANRADTKLILCFYTELRKASGQPEYLVLFGHLDRQKRSVNVVLMELLLSTRVSSTEVKQTT